MRAFANLSIRDKLVGIILVSTLLSVGTGFALVIRKNLLAFQSDLINNTETIAQIISDEAAFLLFFENDVDPAKESERLEKLKSVPWISEAHLYNARGKLFISYTRDGEPDRPTELHDDPPETHFEFAGGFVHFFTPIIRQAEDEPDSWLGTLYIRASTETYQARVQEDVLYMAGLMLAVLLLALTLAFLLQGVISKPILHLAGLAQRISSDADYSVRVEKPGNDEIGILYDGFNNMLEQIQQRQEELKRSNRDLDQFAYVASHDLKAPLRAIATLSGWIEEDLQGHLSPEAQEQMRLLRSRVQRMDGLIEGILQYSRVGRLDTQKERVDVGRMLRELVDLLSPPATFQIVVGPNMPTLTTKRLRLEQVFSNLVTNAIKYHDRPDGRVEINARRRGSCFEFSVSDDGPGIAAEHHKKVFMMFQTLQPRDQVESTGLGLSLVKKLVEEEGGTISLDSAPGRGATFRFTWPANHDEIPSEEDKS